MIQSPLCDFFNFKLLINLYSLNIFKGNTYIVYEANEKVSQQNMYYVI